MLIRSETAADIPLIHRVVAAAFNRPDEADLVNALRTTGDAVVSLVAEDGGAIVGHILFSPVRLVAQPFDGILGLAPLAVLPERQRQGVGSALVREGLDRCRRAGAAAVVVLGHAAYYPRFGFVPASRYRLTSEYNVPDDVFLALELQPQALQGKHGIIRYAPPFASF